MNVDEPLDVAASLEFRASKIQGMGAFAKVTIPVGQPVIEYVGEKISKAESLRRCEADNPFIFNLDEETDLDGDIGWNPAKFINHSCTPNCETEIFGDQIWVMAIRDIEPGEELTFNYNYELEDYKEHPCQCGSADCVGYIIAEEYFPKFRRQMEAAPIPVDAENVGVPQA